MRLAPLDWRDGRASYASLVAREIDGWADASASAPGIVAPIVPGDRSEYALLAGDGNFTRSAIKAQRRNPMQRVVDVTRVPPWKNVERVERSIVPPRSIELCYRASVAK